MSVQSPWARSTATLLSRMGHSVHIVHFYEKQSKSFLAANSRCQESTIEAFVNSMSSYHQIIPRTPLKLHYILAGAPLRRIARKCHADVILSMYSGGAGLTTYLSGFRPYATYAVGSDVLKTHGVNRWIVQRILKSAHTVLANGLYLADQTRKMSPDANVVPLYLGVDVERFFPGTPPTSPVHVVCTRGFVSIYNNEYLIRALALMPEGLPDFRVTFASPGPSLPMVRDLADTILPPAMRRRVEFLGGVPDAKLPSFLQSAHVYASLSRTDGTSTAILEALACGLYPILSDIPQNHEWIDRTSPNGLLVPLDQPQKLADALATAIKGEELRSQAVLRNRQMILDRADSSQTMKTLSTILESTMKTHEFQ